MGIPLSVLLVEDSPDDAELLELDLKRGGYDPKLVRVQTLEAFRRALTESKWDIVISDYSLPGCNGLEVLDAFNAAALDIPFILMSGVVGEDIAAEAMVRGAHDYIMKSRRARLLPAIARELTATHVWREKQESEKRFTIAIQNAEVGYFRIGVDGRFQQVNQAWLRMHGYDSADEVLGQTYVLTQVESDLSGADDIVAKLLRGESCRGEFSRRRKDGSVGYHTYSVTPITQDREVVGFEGFLIDTTDRRWSEEALKESQEKYREIFDVTDEALMLVDVETGRFLEANRAACGMYGYDRDEILTKTILDLSAEPEKTRETSLRAHSGRVFIPHRLHKRKNGTIFPVEFSLRYFQLRGRLVHIGAIRDITERQAAYEALRRSEERYRRLFNAGTDGILLLFGPDRPDLLPGRFIEANDVICRKLGYTREELLCMTPGDINAPDMPHPDQSVVERLLAEGQATWEGAHMTRDGHRIPVEISAHHFDMDGAPVTLASVRDITDRKRAEDELRKFRTVCDSASYGVLILDLQGIVHYVNPSIAESHGFTRGEVIGRSFTDFFAPENVAVAHAALHDVLHTGSLPLTEIVALYKDGTEYPALASGTLIRDEKGEPQFIAASVVDISERRQLEDQLRQAQKMEAVGQLAGGIAHDFNNMLSVILGYSDLMLTSPGACAPDSRDWMLQIHKAAERAKQVTAQLLAFSRKQVLDVRPLDVNQVIADFEKMLQRLIGEDIAVVTLLRPGLGTVLADAAQIGQILINLAVNARDAMTDGGNLTLETANLTLDDDLAAVYPGVPAGSYVVISVTDTGCGMDAETQKHMFEPFFTTKAKGKGTGLGLATVYGIVKQHCGEITVQSTPGAGSTFRVYLPRRTEEPETVAVAADKRGARGRSESVLVTEDDPVLRELVCRILVRHGYQALEAGDGQDAVRVAAQRDDVRLLLTDVVMPDMNGREVAEQVLAIRPNVKVLFMSGYADDVLAEKGALAPGVHLIKKPFSAVSLIDKVRALLSM